MLLLLFYNIISGNLFNILPAYIPYFRYGWV